jgi:hypothetical protein
MDDLASGRRGPSQQSGGEEDGERAQEQGNNQGMPAHTLCESSPTYRRSTSLAGAKDSCSNPLRTQGPPHTSQAMEDEEPPFRVDEHTQEDRRPSSTRVPPPAPPSPGPQGDASTIPSLGRQPGMDSTGGSSDDGEGSQRNQVERTHDRTRPKKRPRLQQGDHTGETPPKTPQVTSKKGGSGQKGAKGGGGDKGGGDKVAMDGGRGKGRKGSSKEVPTEPAGSGKRKTRNSGKSCESCRALQLTVHPIPLFLLLTITTIGSTPIHRGAGTGPRVRTIFITPTLFSSASGIVLQYIII